MKKGKISIKLKGKPVSINILYYGKEDKQTLVSIYNSWKTLCDGLKDFDSRAVNLPEGLSEPAFCINFNSARVVDSKVSYDAIHLKTKRGIQIKATSCYKDLTSFGPNTKWDDLYWLDFYRDGKLDGKFDIYKLKSSLIYNYVVNKSKKETFKDQQKQKRRPRINIRQGIIIPNKIKPIKTCKI